MSDSSKELKEIDMACVNNNCIHYNVHFEDNCSLYGKDAFIYCEYDYKRELNNMRKSILFTIIFSCSFTYFFLKLIIIPSYPKMAESTDFLFGAGAVGLLIGYCFSIIILLIIYLWND